MAIADIDALTVTWKAALTDVETAEDAAKSARRALMVAMTDLAAKREAEVTANKALEYQRSLIYDPGLR